jgi:glycogen debranching enzyme
MASLPQEPASPSPVCERVGWRRGEPPEQLLAREWLLTNGLGGYAAGTLGGVPTRRFHGLLVAALPAPLGRVMTVNHLVETARLADGTVLGLGGVELTAGGPPSLPEWLAEFRVVDGKPRWLFERDGLVLERTVTVPYGRNATYVSYRLIVAAEPLALVLAPAVDIRPHEGALSGPPKEYEARAWAQGMEIRRTAPKDAYPPVYVEVVGDAGATLIKEPETIELRYRVERARGYDSEGSSRIVGRFEVTLRPGAEVSLTVSTERPNRAFGLAAAETRALDDERRRRLISQADPALRLGIGAELVLGADQFVIDPHVRPGDEARLRASGDDARTVIAGYPWFTDWGRDTMISLEGLTLVTGRHAEARDILHTFASHVRDGLIPNLFPEGASEGLYHTADATLWFFHALDRYERASGDAELRRALLPVLVDIIERHIAGTRFGIRVDPADGLLRQGGEGVQLTWMDAKVGDWVVTPRRGKAVEINALFYNALIVLERWLREAEREEGRAPAGDGRWFALRADDIGRRAETARRSFNQRFWFPEGQHLYDVVDGDGGQAPDASLRPNQLMAISLPNPVLDPERWEPVLTTVRRELVTPFGLRTLARGHADYKSRYDGDRRARDAAYHQGTIWPWLLGPFVEAWIKTYPNQRTVARGFLEGLDQAMGRQAIGTIPEIFDAEEPFAARGCLAQAWSVAEALRALVMTADRTSEIPAGAGVARALPP